jgi:hypothetical protein
MLAVHILAILHSPVSIHLLVICQFLLSGAIIGLVRTRSDFLVINEVALLTKLSLRQEERQRLEERVQITKNDCVCLLLLQVRVIFAGTA